MTSVVSSKFLISRPFSGGSKSRFGVAFLVAGLVTGVNWIAQTQLARVENDRQEELIKRVNERKTANVDDLRDLNKINDLEGSIVKVTGELQPGRFVVKRKRGDQDGYLVLAPFVVSSTKFMKDLSKHSLNEKYMLNLGWVPKESKHKIKETAAVDILEFDQLPEELASEEDAPALSTFEAYIRKGEQEDIFRGYRNWAQDRLYKFIDLPFLEKMYYSFYPSFRHIYLDRIGKEGSTEWFPLPKTEEGYIEQIKEQIDYNNKKRQRASYGVGIVSFATAALVTLL